MWGCTTTGDVPQPPMIRRFRSRYGAYVFEELGVSQAAAMEDIASSFKLVRPAPHAAAHKGTVLWVTLQTLA